MIIVLWLTMPFPQWINKVVMYLVSRVVRVSRKCKKCRHHLKEEDSSEAVSWLLGSAEQAVLR